MAEDKKKKKPLELDLDFEAVEADAVQKATDVIKDLRYKKVNVDIGTKGQMNTLKRVPLSDIKTEIDAKVTADATDAVIEADADWQALSKGQDYWNHAAYNAMLYEIESIPFEVTGKTIHIPYIMPENGAVGDVGGYVNTSAFARNGWRIPLPYGAYIDFDYIDNHLMENGKLKTGVTNFDKHIGDNPAVILYTGDNRKQVRGNDNTFKRLKMLSDPYNNRRYFQALSLIHI